MNNAEINNSEDIDAVQCATFRCGELMVGLDLTDVQEINRIDRFAHVPEAPSEIRGVINLRGEVITMIDLRVVLNQTVNSNSSRSHNVFVRSEGEVIGLVTDGVSDILTIRRSEIDASPANVRGSDASFFTGVHTPSSDNLIVILNLPQVLSHCEPV